MEVRQSNTNKSAENLEKNGFAFLPQLFSEEQAQKAHEELEFCFQQDLKARSEQKIEEAHWNGPAGHTVLTRPSHLLIDAYAKSPTLDLMFEEFLTSEKTKPLLEKLAGPNIKLRGYNIRRMTGAYDPPPSHEWHRDSNGEFGFGILLTDIAPEENAATAFVPGSHLFPYCPRWNNLFYNPPGILPKLVRYGFFNKLLGYFALKNRTGAFGKKGDAYIFINDTWHGRQPNLHGKESMVVLIGAFPTDYEFPDQVTPPSPHILDQLPTHVKAVASCKLPKNESLDTILKKTIKNRIPLRPISLWKLAQVERKFLTLISKPLLNRPRSKFFLLIESFFYRVLLKLRLKKRNI